MLGRNSISLDGEHAKRNQWKHFVITAFKKVTVLELGQSVDARFPSQFTEKASFCMTW